MKKFISGILAIGITLSSVLSFTSSSAFDPTKDPNGDGHLTIADSTAILQYLGGYYEPSNLSQLDVDNNHVVSVVDSEYVVMYDSGMITSSVQQPIDTLNNTPTSRRFVVFNADGSFNRYYLLSYTDYSNTASSNNTRALYDPTSQTEDWSNKGVAKIMCSTAENSIGYLGTGFVVGPHTIATAAHVVFANDTDTAPPLSSILLFDSEQNEHHFTPVESHISFSYYSSVGQSNHNDYALITVEEDLSDYMSFNLGAITDTANSASLPISVVGFPSNYEDFIENSPSLNTNSLHNEMLSEGILTSEPNIDNIYHNAYTSKGYSGAPIYTTEILNGKTYRTVIGIHVARGGVGIRMNSQVLKFLKSNPNIRY